MRAAGQCRMLLVPEVEDFGTHPPGAAPLHGRSGCRARAGQPTAVTFPPAAKHRFPGKVRDEAPSLVTKAKVSRDLFRKP